MIFTCFTFNKIDEIRTLLVVWRQRGLQVTTFEFVAMIVNVIIILDWAKSRALLPKRPCLNYLWFLYSQLIFIIWLTKFIKLDFFKGNNLLINITSVLYCNISKMITICSSSAYKMSTKFNNTIFRWNNSRNTADRRCCDGLN